MADWQVARVPPYVRRPFPSKENRQISERDDLGPPVVPGGEECRSVWDPETSRERIGDWDGPDGLGPLVCCRKAKRRVGV